MLLNEGSVFVFDIIYISPIYDFAGKDKCRELILMWVNFNVLNFLKC